MARLIDLPELIVRDVAELPDRTSPEDQPDMMLVTGAELDRIIMDRVAQVKDHEIERLRAALAEIIELRPEDMPHAIENSMAAAIARHALTNGQPADEQI